jgi:hypothetical protein
MVTGCIKKESESATVHEELALLAKKRACMPMKIEVLI